MAKNTSGSGQGFIPLRDSSGKLDSRRRAINPSTGEVISLRQYQKLQKQGLAPVSKRQTDQPKAAPTPKRQAQPKATKTSNQPVVAKTRAASQARNYYKQEVGTFMDARNKQLANAGLPLYTKRSEVIRSAEFKAYYQAIKPPSKGMSEDQKKKWNDPKGKKAQALVKLGLRQPDADYPVGETPDSGY